MPSVKGDVIWGQTMGPGFTRIAQPAFLIRMIPGSDPTKTAVSEIFQSPPGTYGSRGVDIDSKGVAWTVLSSGQMASFDRSKCKEKLEGTERRDRRPVLRRLDAVPDARTAVQRRRRSQGQRQPRLLYLGRRPQHARTWKGRADRHGQWQRIPAGSGRTASSSISGSPTRSASSPRTPTAGSTIRTPAGRAAALWTTTGTRAYFHSESGKDESPRVFHVQMRPDPLAD